MKQFEQAKWIVSALLLIAFIPMTGIADDVGEAARSVMVAQKDAVLTVKLVIKQEMSYGGREGTKQESKSEVTGTVINDEGLIVASLSATDPGGTFKKMMENMSMGRDNQMKISTDLTDIKIISPSGKEIAAEVVLRDRDLDLAFIRPQEKQDTPLAFIDLSRRKEPKVLDQVVIMNRLGKVASRVPAVTLARIAAMVEKPRTFYVVDQPQNGFGLGTPVFTMDGSPIGIMLLRSIKTQGGGGFGAMFSGGNNLGLLPILLPFEDVLESAGQVPAMEKNKDSVKTTL